MPAAISQHRRALGYIRVSSYLGRDRDDALTEALQLEKIQQWCAVADLDLIDVLRDIDRSGKDFDVKGRPAFDELMRRLESGEASAVVVYRMARFGRDFYETVRTVRRLRSLGVQFHSASERIDLESPNGRLMFNVLASFDEYELDVRREYWAETKARVMHGRGVHLGRTPLGYLRASKKPKLPCDVTLERAGEILAELGSSRSPVSGGLVPDPALAAEIRRAYELRAAGAPIGEVAAMLNAAAPRSGGRRWTRTQVQRLLGLRVYLGEVHHGEIVVPDAHEPVTDTETFLAAQRVSTKRAPRSRCATFHLRGMIRCAGCGFPMTGWNQPRRRANGRVDRVRVYRCVRERAGGRCCSRAVVSADAAEAVVRTALEPYARQLVATMEGTPTDGRLLGVQADLARIDERLAMLNGDLRGELDNDLWKQALIDQGTQRRELVAHQDELLAAGETVQSTIGWGDMTAAEQFEVMLRALDAVVVRRAAFRGQPVEERLSLYDAGTIQHLLPGPSNGWQLQPFDFAAADVLLSAA